MLKFSVTTETENRLKSLQERMANRGFQCDVEELLEAILSMGLEQAERAAEILVPFDPKEGEE
ncbi:MAG: hypothetical protein K6U04_05445 [Armatimonadetes bacterium]|nr:hypothetical protein [Armatimonadota bacterium]